MNEHETVYEYLVVDNEFNRAWYPHLVGQVFANPPSYAHLQVRPVVDAEASDCQL